ncbi:cyclic lactone autoinducer peptide [Alteribacter populi]|uniref:cyclic lactone autoinducer peptide n=1 Tax=Alteribacter populi TaxID=2011011 RepID=UPI0018E2D04F|nr:cyclic lactone autoinducer peptide [Alteribacter populi]
MIKLSEYSKLRKVIPKVISVIGVSCGEAALERSCFMFTYEPEIPEELQEKEK